MFGEEMNELSLFEEKTVTTKELAERLDVDIKTVNNTVERIGDLLGSTSQKSFGGRPTKVFNEKQATLIMQEIQKHHNLASRQIDSVTTELEENQTIANAMMILQRRNNELKQRAELAEQKNALLMHTKKTYTASEIAKEVGLPSAIKLNQFLKEKGLQYYRNGTWLPTAKYSDKGYYEIKQDLLDNGIVIYNSRITQKGRDFILSLFELAKGA